MILKDEKEAIKAVEDMVNHRISSKKRRIQSIDAKRIKELLKELDILLQLE